MSPFLRDLFGALVYSTPVVIGLGTVEAAVLAWVARRAYDWRAFLEHFHIEWR